MVVKEIAQIKFYQTKACSKCFQTSDNPILTSGHRTPTGPKCSSTGSNVLQFSDRCYIAFNASISSQLSWYEARNRCLKDGGDLASFANATSINFTSWLIPDPNVPYWIGLRFSWYIWRDSGSTSGFRSFCKVDQFLLYI